MTTRKGLTLPYSATIQMSMRCIAVSLHSIADTLKTLLATQPAAPASAGSPAAPVRADEPDTPMPGEAYYDYYRRAVEQGLPVAVRCRDILAAAGYGVTGSGRNPDKIGAVKTCMLHAQDAPIALCRALILLRHCATQSSIQESAPHPEAAMRPQYGEPSNLTGRQKPHGATQSPPSIPRHPMTCGGIGVTPVKLIFLSEPLLGQKD